METIIEESIWCVEQKLPLRKCVLKYDGKSITRNLFILGDSEHKNSKIDIIDEFHVSIQEINNMNALELGNMLKHRLINCFKRNINNEILFFISPIITKK